MESLFSKRGVPCQSARVMIPRVVLFLALVLPAFAQDAVPALHEQVAAEYENAEARLKSLQDRIAGALDEAKRTEFTAVQENGSPTGTPPVAITVALAAPKPELTDYFRYLELNKLTRDRITTLERIASVPAVPKS